MSTFELQLIWLIGSNVAIIGLVILLLTVYNDPPNHKHIY